MKRAGSILAYIRDLDASKSAQCQYRKRAAELREQAHVDAEEGRPLTARRNRYYADMAQHAARSEWFDVDPEFVE